MQEENLENLDKHLQNILISKNMSVYKNNYDYFLFDNEKINPTSEFISNSYKRTKFTKVENFFTDIEKYNYNSISIDKEAKNIFNELYTNKKQIERDYLVKNYYYFITFDQMFAYLGKNEDKSTAINFVTNNALKGKIRKVEKEEILLKKIYNIEPHNFYNNLLNYLSNHAQIYSNNSHYQGMLKNLICEYLPDKRKDFANFTGDSQKKYINNTSILYENDKNQCEILISFNKTVIEEKFIPEILKEKHEITSLQNKIINNLDSLIKASKRLNIKEVVSVHTKEKEIITFYITKDKNDITKEDVGNYVESCLEYWKENIIDLKDKSIENMIDIIEKNAEINTLYKNFNNKYTIKNINEKKVKI